MPWVEALFGSFGAVTTRPGRAISRGDLADADVLLVRSVTAVNRSLLEGTPVRFVGSATIGTDHVDTDYLAQQGIAFSNAPGCNADAVVNYVVACLCALEPDLKPWALSVAAMSADACTAACGHWASTAAATTRFCHRARCRTWWLSIRCWRPTSFACTLRSPSPVPIPLTTCLIGAFWRD